jgi:hypothetical protein
VSSWLKSGWCRLFCQPPTYYSQQNGQQPSYQQPQYPPQQHYSAPQHAQQAPPAYGGQSAQQGYQAYGQQVRSFVPFLVELGV